ncbi:MAG TPA: 5-formyltetrahydrofolate cyclo-ligase [Phycisphaerales bacterium]|nr:5-formyltetrahydrofolate cyclo-ligase [Phycisphaerales bacterium]
MTKQELRASLKQTLNNLSPEVWRRGSEGVCARLSGLVEQAGARAVMFFFPTAGEVDVGPAAVECLGRGVRVCLPRAEWATGGMSARVVTVWGENLSLTRHGLREPAESAPPVDLADLDLIVVPGLGFDAAGGRLGRGGGFYDRFLSRPQVRAWKVAVGLDEQVVASVPRDAWDVGMDALVTPTRTLVFNPYATPPTAH